MKKLGPTRFGERSEVFARVACLQLRRGPVALADRRVVCGEQLRRERVAHPVPTVADHRRERALVP
jgi:hypothetical protein